MKRCVLMTIRCAHEPKVANARIEDRNAALSGHTTKDGAV